MSNNLVSDFKRFVVDELFNPVELKDWKVEEIHMAPKDFAVFRKEFGPDLDIEVNAELLKEGIYGYLWSAQIRVSKTNLKDHVTVKFGNLELSHVVCLKAKKMTGGICLRPECVVEAVHAL